MSRESFAALLHKYQTGKASDAEKEVVAQWYALLEEEPRYLSEADWKLLEDRLWRKLSRDVSEYDPELPATTVPLWQRPIVRFAAAAALALLLGVSYLLYQSQAPEVLSELTTLEEAGGLELAVNRTDDTLAVLLEDGSRVSLSPRAQLQYPAHFAAGKRVVSLTGEAFFKIAEDRQRPFYVEAGQIVTKVLGTSFSIRAQPDDPNVEVAVRTGKVSVFEKEKGEATQSNKQGNGVILSPNHRVTFSASNKQFVETLVEEPALPPVVVREKASAFQYREVPLAQILDDLEKAYQIEIELDSRTLGACAMTANLSGKSFYSQLEIICATIQGTYEVKSTTILISGKGCE